MWLILLEALGALVILLLIVWWTMFSGRRGGERRKDDSVAPGRSEDTERPPGGPRTK